jgi:hypothetical protein
VTRDIEVEDRVRRTLRGVAAEIDAFSGLESKPRHGRGVAFGTASVVIAVLAGGLLYMTSARDGSQTMKVLGSSPPVATGPEPQDEPAAGSAAPMAAPPYYVLAGTQWRMDTVEINDIGSGEVGFTDDTEHLVISWTSPSMYDQLWQDRLKGSSSHQAADVDGRDATVFQMDGYATALWGVENFTVEARAENATTTALVALLNSIRRVERREWIDALPAGALSGVAADQAIRETVADVPLPPELNVDMLVQQSNFGNLEQLQLAAFTTVICAWIERWLTATEAGDPVDAAQAVEALTSSHAWQQLLSKPFAENLWKYADGASGKLITGGSEPVALTRTSAASLCA